VIRFRFVCAFAYISLLLYVWTKVFSHHFLTRDASEISVGYDTFKLYHDIDTDTFSEKYHDTDTWYIYKKVSWYWYILNVSW